MKKIALFLWKIPLFLQVFIMVVGGGVVGILIFVEVFLRYVMGSPLFGIEELILFIGMWLYFMGASYGAYERTHIKAELIDIWCKDKKNTYDITNNSQRNYCCSCSGSGVMDVSLFQLGTCQRWYITGTATAQGLVSKRDFLWYLPDGYIFYHRTD